MARSNIDVRLRLRGARQFQKDAAASSTALGSFGKRAIGVGRGMQAAGGRMRSMGRSMIGFTLAAAGAGKFALDFGDAMNQLQTQAGVSAEETSRLHGEVLALARSGDVSVGPKALADGLFRLASSGVETKDAMEALRHAEDLATVGRSDLESTTTALGGAVNALQLDTSEYGRTVGELNAIVGQGNMRMEDLVSAMGTGVLGAFKTAGLGLDDFGASLATLTAAGQPANRAATGLSSLVLQMGKETPKATKALEGIGIEWENMVETMTDEGLVPVLRMLEEGLEGMSQADQLMVLGEIFPKEQVRTAGLLLANLDGMEGRLGNIAKNAKGFKDDVESAREEPIVRMREAWSQLQGTLIEVAIGAMPRVADGLEKITDFASGALDVFRGLPDPVQRFGKASALIAVVASPVLIILGSVVSALGTMAVAAGKAAIALAWLGKAMLKLIPMQVKWLVGMALARVRLLMIAAAAKVKAVALGALTLATKAATGAMWLLNIAMRANPIMFVVTALVALVAGVILAYKRVGWFRDGVDKAFNAIKDVVSFVVGFIGKHWEKLLVILTGPIGLAVVLVIRNFSRIRNAAAAVIGWIRSNWRLLAAILFGPFGIAVGVITKHWGSIKQGASNAVGAVKRAMDGLVGFFRGMPGKMRSAVSGMWDGLKDAFRNSLNWVIRKWNGLKFKTPSIGKGPFKTPSVTIGVPEVPELGSGGFIPFGQFGSFVTGEAGPELQTITRAGITVQPIAAGDGPLVAETPVQLFLDGRLVAESTARHVRRKKSTR